jgi:hypothetical protein
MTKTDLKAQINVILIFPILMKKSFSIRLPSSIFAIVLGNVLTKSLTALAN